MVERADSGVGALRNWRSNCLERSEMEGMGGGGEDWPSRMRWAVETMLE